MDSPGSSKGEERAQLMVIGKYKFEGRNNDELSFAKNDIITVTQQLEGGWWEGSLEGRIGWFPADFVGIVKNSAEGKAKKKGGANEGQNGGGIDQSKLEANRTAFRAQLVKEFLTKEKENLGAIERALEALGGLAKESAEIGKEELVGESIGKLGEFVQFKRKLVGRMEEETKKTLQAQKIGQLFLDVASEMRANLRRYCGKHCDLVELLNRKKGEELKGGGLVPGLSLVFRHVQKYGAMLREIERNTPEAHPDRGNLLRASQVYLEFHEECETVRRQREAQLDFVEAGVLQENYGADFEAKLGKLLYTGKVGVLDGKVNLMEEEGPEGEEPRELDRCISIFSSTILLLEMQIPSGKYSLKNRFGTADLAIKQFDSKNAVQLMKGKDALIVKSVGKKDYGQLLEALRESCGAQMQNGEMGNENASPLRKKCQKAVANLDQSDSSSKTANQSPAKIGNFRVDHQLEMILPDGLFPHSNANSAANENGNAQMAEESGGSKPYSGWALRPMAPQRASWFPDSELDKLTQQIKLRKGLSAEEQEDALLLKIVEGYCLSGGGPSSANIHSQCCRQRQRNSADSCHHSPCGGGTVRRAASYPDHPELGRPPQLIVAEEEKLFVEEMEGDQMVMKEKSLVDTVYALKDQLSALTKDVATIAKTLEHEQRARRRMEEYIRQNGGNSNENNNNFNEAANNNNNSSSISTVPMPNVALVKPSSANRN